MSLIISVISSQNITKESKIFDNFREIGILNLKIKIVISWGMKDSRVNVFSFFFINTTSYD